MKQFLRKIKQKARKNPQKIVFPEAALDDRVLKAVEIILKEKTAYPILLGSPVQIVKKAKDLKLKINFKKVPIINPETSGKAEKYMKKLLKLRASKGMTEKEAWVCIYNINYFGTMMVYLDEVDAMISGSACPTSETLRPALQIIKTKKKFHKVSGFFFMILENRLLLFADCSVNINPNSHDLCDIAIDTAETARRFGLDPKIALLSFSTAGSAKHPLVDKVKEAVALIRYKRPDFVVEGEMQVDAALVPEICKRKFPNSKLKGNANILIFPDLQAANISYKLVERLGGAKAIGPILQGLKKPVNDLSRGCSVSDIVDLTAITTLEAQEETYL